MPSGAGPIWFTCVIALTCSLLGGGCKGLRQTPPGIDAASGTDATRAVSCACSDYPSRRCSGDKTQVCETVNGENGAWTATGQCNSNQICVVGRCEARGQGCAVSRVDYDGKALLVEWATPVAVGDCFEAGELGANIVFGDTKVERMPRALKLDFLACDAPVLNGSQVFGMAVDGEAVSATTSPMTGHIWPHEYGRLFRQRAKLIRVATLWDARGAYLGAALLTDWQWAYEVVTAPSCPASSSSLPPAAQFPLCVTQDLSDGCGCD